jgi:phosphoglycolate phosphatase
VAVPLLVLWDIDQTLITANGTGLQIYANALRQMYGLEMPRSHASFAGRTDSAIALEILSLAGVPEPAEQVQPFQAFMAARAAEMIDGLRARGRALPGAAEALAALALAQRDGDVVQSLLTGNLPEFAQVKLAAFGLAEHLDLTIGAYGDLSAIRADLVDVARSKATALHGADFAGRQTVLVGDTPSDVEAALLTGASAIAVATGSFTMDELAAAGAHVVLPSLADTPAVVAAILAAPQAAP